MKKLLRTAALCLGLAAGFVQTALAQEGVDIGTKIFPKSPIVEIRVQNRAVGQAGDLKLPVTVLKVNGDWLWVRVDDKPTEGWIQRKDVCTAQEAIEYHTKMIAQAPDLDYFPFCRSVAYLELGQYDAAIKDQTECIRLAPKSAWAYLNRALLRAEKKDFENVIKDCTEAIRLGSQSVHAFNERGNAYAALKSYDLAAADFTAALQIDPQFVPALLNRGDARIQQQQQYSQALADYRAALQIDPQNFKPYDRMAWQLATCPDAKVRNGRRAVEYATKSCELTGWKDALVIDTLAAAYAESGDFKQAVKYQAQAVDLVSPELKSNYQARLKLYQSGQSSRTTVVAAQPFTAVAAPAPPPAP